MMASVRWNKSRVRPLFPSPGLRLLGPWLILTTLLGATSLPAQELIRSSALKPEIQSFKNPEVTFRLGPLQEILTGSADVEYTDNVNLTDTDRISDLSFHQFLNLNTTWTISHLNQLKFDFGGQLIENFYGNGKTRINFAISPDSMIQVQFAISNFRVRLYDQFSYVQNPTTNPIATNTANLNSLTNTVGGGVDADVGLAILSLSADYTYNNQSGTTSGGQTNAATSGTRNTFRAGPTLTFSLSPEIFYGLESSTTRSTGTDSSNVNSLSVGGFMKGSLSKSFELDFAGGVNLIDAKPSIPPGYYFSADVRYQIDRYWQLLLSASHDFIFTTGTGVTEETTFSAGTQLALTQFLTLTGGALVNFGDTKTTTTAAIANGSVQGNFTQYGANASLSFKLRKHWSTAVTYKFARLESDTAANTYIQNTITFGISYSF